MASTPSKRTAPSSERDESLEATMYLSRERLSTTSAPVDNKPRDRVKETSSPDPTPPAATRPAAMQKFIIDPLNSGHPVEIDPLLRQHLDDKHQVLIVWHDSWGLTWEVVRKMWMTPGLGYLAAGFSTITLTGLQRAYYRHAPGYYKLIDKLMPNRSVDDQKRNGGVVPKTVHPDYLARVRAIRDGEDAKDIESAEGNTSGPAVVDPVPSEYLMAPRNTNRSGPEVPPLPTKPTNSKYKVNLNPGETRPSQTDPETAAKNLAGNHVTVTHPARSYIPETATTKDIARFNMNRNGSTITFYLRDHRGNIVPDANPLVIDANAAARSSNFINRLLHEDFTMSHLLTKKGESKVILGRFIQCISPNVRSGLTTHDITISPSDSDTVTSKKIEWSTQDLQDIYRLAHEMECLHVKDMVTDHFRKVIVTTRKLPGLVRFINWLGECGSSEYAALNFWTDIIAAGNMEDREFWNEHVREALRIKTERGEMKKGESKKRIFDLAIKHPAEYCRRFHAHDELCYVQLAEKRINCEMKVQMAEWAIVLNQAQTLADAKVSKMSAKNNESMSERERMATTVNADHTILEVNALLKDAVRHYDIEWFVKRDRLGPSDLGWFPEFVEEGNGGELTGDQLQKRKGRLKEEACALVAYLNHK